METTALYEQSAHCTAMSTFDRYADIAQSIASPYAHDQTTPTRSKKLLYGTYLHADGTPVTIGLMKLDDEEDDTMLLFFNDDESVHFLRVLAHITPEGCYGTDQNATRIDSATESLYCDLIQRTFWDAAKTEELADFYRTESAW